MLPGIDACPMFPTVLTSYVTMFRYAHKVGVSCVCCHFTQTGICSL